MAGGFVAGFALLLLSRIDAFVPSVAIVRILAIGSSSATAGLQRPPLVPVSSLYGPLHGWIPSGHSFGMIAASLGAGIVFESIGIQAVFVGAGCLDAPNCFPSSGQFCMARTELCGRSDMLRMHRGAYARPLSELTGSSATL